MPQFVYQKIVNSVKKYLTSTNQDTIVGFGQGKNQNVDFLVVYIRVRLLKGNLTFSLPPGAKPSEPSL